MFVRGRLARGKPYYQVVESYREGGKVKTRHLLALGDQPSVAGATAATEKAIKWLKRKIAEQHRMWGPRTNPPTWQRRDLAVLERKLTLHLGRLEGLRQLPPDLAATTVLQPPTLKKPKAKRAQR